MSIKIFNSYLFQLKVTDSNVTNYKIHYATYDILKSEDDENLTVLKFSLLTF